MVERFISLPVRSAKLFTLASHYAANRELLGNVQDDEATIPSMVATAVTYWDECPNTSPLDESQERGSARDRVPARKHLRPSVVMRALGAAGGDLMKEIPEHSQERLAALESVDWSKKNKDWENVCIVANSVVRTARRAAQPKST